MSDVTRVLSAIEQGDPSAAAELLPLVYEELRKLAAARLVREKPGQTLQATALVHEAYLRLVGNESSQHWNSRGHFFGAAAEAMRRIVIERARRKGPGDREQLPLDDLEIAIPAAAAGILAVDEALSRLEIKDPVAAQLIKLRFFAGLTMQQAAEALGMPLRSAERNWTYARTWLQRELSRDVDRFDG
jgi:RNA polymerase sigma factor (TIGR02999 family)